MINYYLVKGKDRIHLGQKSYGWAFCFNIIDKIKYFKWLRPYIESKIALGYKIIDDKNTILPLDNFYEIIKKNKRTDFDWTFLNERLYYVDTAGFNFKKR